MCVCTVPSPVLSVYGLHTLCTLEDLFQSVFLHHIYALVAKFCACAHVHLFVCCRLPCAWKLSVPSEVSCSAFEIFLHFAVSGTTRVLEKAKESTAPPISESNSFYIMNARPKTPRSLTEASGLDRQPATPKKLPSEVSRSQSGAIDPMNPPLRANNLLSILNSPSSPSLHMKEVVTVPRSRHLPKHTVRTRQSAAGAATAAARVARC